MTAGELATLRADSAARLVHRCTVERTTTTDEWTGAGSTVSVLANAPCLYIERPSREVTAVGGVRIVTQALVLLAHDAPVNETDVLTVVSDQTGAQLVGEARGITAIVRLPGHVEVILEGAGR